MRKRSPGLKGLNLLWAPWRIGYITNAESEKGCFLCRARDERKDKKNLVIFKGKRAFVVMNRFPYTNGHLMVAPRRHVGTLEALKEAEVLDLMEAIVLAKRALEKSLKPHAYNIGLNLGRAAGAGLEDHLHIHVVPRWVGDTNFMPVVAGAKVISQSLGEAYVLLKKEIAGIVHTGRT